MAGWRLDVCGLRDQRVIAYVYLVFPADAQEMEPVLPPARAGPVCATWPQGPRGFHCSGKVLRALGRASQEPARSCH